MPYRPSLLLSILLLSFPQVVETIYSPVLPQISTAYRVTPEQAGQTLSIWFMAFAIGVVAWGRLADTLGRRPALLFGLALYAVGSVWAMITLDFYQLLGARTISAFGAAVGSIVVQTALRDKYAGKELQRVFAVLGLALAVSPAVGLFAGQLIANHAGHDGIFTALGLLSASLLILCIWKWPETRPEALPVAPLGSTLKQMLRDHHIRHSAVLIAVFNIAIFAWYQLGPFLFDQLEQPFFSFGDSGFLLGMGALAGALTNRALLQGGLTAHMLTWFAIVMLAIGAMLVVVLSSLWPQNLFFISGMVLVSFSYAIAIPNVLAGALTAYGERLGTAGAILSLLYYSLLGIGLAVAAYGQQLGFTLAVCAGLAALSACYVQRGT